MSRADRERRAGQRGIAEVRVVALTGTPGTGKTSVGKLLAGKGFDVVELGRFIDQRALWDEMDEERGSKVVDEVALSEALQGVLREARAKDTVLVLEGHLSHLVRGVDVAVVLRCHPEELEKRMAARGWPPAKVAENREAEAIDVVLIEAAEAAPVVLEVDTTGRAAAEVAEEVAALLRKPEPEAWSAHRPGRIDWSATL